MIADFLRGVDLHHAPVDVPLAVGGILDAPSVLAAARLGVYPLPANAQMAELAALRLAEDVAIGRVHVLGGRADPFTLAWWHPDPRWVLTTDAIRHPRSAVRSIRRNPAWNTTIDTDITGVLAGCADRDWETWLDPDARSAFATLGAEGWVRSVELWDGDNLVAGLFGLLLGTTFTVESAFSRVDNGAKVVLLDLADRLSSAGVRHIDVQERTPLAETMGAGPEPAEQLRSRLRVAPSHPRGNPVLPDGSRPATAVLRSRARKFESARSPSA